MNGFIYEAWKTTLLIIPIEGEFVTEKTVLVGGVRRKARRASVAYFKTFKEAEDFVLIAFRRQYMTAKFTLERAKRVVAKHKIDAELRMQE